MGEFVTAEAARQRFMALLDAVDAAHAEMRALSTDDVSSRFRAQVAERLETQHRTNRGLMYRMVSELADPPDEAAPMPDLVKRLAARLRISVTVRRCASISCAKLPPSPGKRISEVTEVLWTRPGLPRVAFPRRQG